MKNSTSLIAAGIAVAGLFAFSGSVLAQGMGMGPNLDNMFLDADTDNFDPGLLFCISDAIESVSWIWR